MMEKPQKYKHQVSVLLRIENRPKMYLMVIRLASLMIEPREETHWGEINRRRKRRRRGKSTKLIVGKLFKTV